MQNKKEIPSLLEENSESMKVIVLARAGAGKTETIKKVIQKLIKEEIIAWEFLTGTTRSPRKGEVNNVDYLFCTEDEFKNGDFVSSIHPGGWVSYGVPYKENSREGIGFFSPISLKYGTDTEEAFRKREPHIKTVFIVLDIDREVRAERMRMRGESEEGIIKRFAIEDDEGPYDLSKLPSNTIVLSDPALGIEEVAEKIIESIGIRKKILDLDKSVKPLSV